GQTPTPRHGCRDGGLPRLGAGVAAVAHRNTGEPHRRDGGAGRLWRRSRPLYRPQQQCDDRRGAGRQSGVAGGLLNLLRVFGAGVGVASASTALGWGLHAATGAGARTTHAPEAALLSAVGGVLAMLAGFGAIGAAAALGRGEPKRAAGKPEA